MASEIPSVDTPEGRLVQRRNFLYVQIDGMAIGFVNAASPFLPVFLSRLDATTQQVALLTTMGGVTGLALSIFMGRFLQTRRNVVPWYSLSRLLYIAAYAFTGLMPFFIPRAWLIPAILGVWALATLPQTMLNVTFSVVMNAVAGPQGRYALMSRRWSILGATTAITAWVSGVMLGVIKFPLNYQLVLIFLSAGGLVSYYFSTRIRIPDNPPVVEDGSHTVTQKGQAFVAQVRGQPAFVSFALKRFIYQFGVIFTNPIFPMYYVQVVKASNQWIGNIAALQTFVLLGGYYFWVLVSRRRGSRFVLLCTTLGIAVYPAMVAATDRVWLVALLAGLAGIFQAGIDLVFFDELMKTVPIEHSATFVSIAQSMQHVASIVAPLASALLAHYIGLGGALLVSAGIRGVGYVLFLLSTKGKTAPAF